MEIIDPSTVATTVAQLNDANRIWKREAEGIAFPSNECKEKTQLAKSGFFGQQSDNGRRVEPSLRDASLLFRSLR